MSVCLDFDCMFVYGMDATFSFFFINIFLLLPLLDQYISPFMKSVFQFISFVFDQVFSEDEKRLSPRREVRDDLLRS